MKPQILQKTPIPIQIQQRAAFMVMQEMDVNEDQKLLNCVGAFLAKNMIVLVNPRYFLPASTDFQGNS